MERLEPPLLHLSVTQVVLIEGEPMGLAEGLGADGVRTIYRDDARALEAIAARLEAGQLVEMDVAAAQVMARSWPATASPSAAPAVASAPAPRGRAPRRVGWRWPQGMQRGPLRVVSRSR